MNEAMVPARGRSLVVAGVIVVVASVLAGVVTMLSADRRADRTVEAFARAPAGCDTAIRFDRGGTFDVYVETSGRLEGIGGTCTAPEEFEGNGLGLPQVQVTLTDPSDGSTLRLGRTTAISYERAGFVGVRFRTVGVDAPVTVVARVEAPAGEDVVVAFGTDPERIASRWTFTGVLVAVIGGVVGFAVFAFGVIRRFGGSSGARPTMSSVPGDAAGAWTRPLGPPGSPLPPPPPPGVAPPTASGADPPTS